MTFSSQKRFHLSAAILATLLFGLTACGELTYQSATGSITQTDEESEQHNHVLSPEQEKEFRTSFIREKGSAPAYRFTQTGWAECTDDITGNYHGIKCAGRRDISAILKNFMNLHIHKCIDQALATQGGGQVSELHVVHNGIAGDPRHSPKSLHAERRAIDIKSLEIRLTSGATKNVVYGEAKNRAFYTAFRNCWGEIVHTYNGCPYYNGQKLYTGTIGWEDRDHQHHMHTSVPFCVSGNYGSGYFRR